MKTWVAIAGILAMKTEPELSWYACYFVSITHSMTEPFFDQTGEGTVHTKMWSQKFKDLRDYALRLPKFGTDTANKEVRTFFIN